MLEVSTNQVSQNLTLQKPCIKLKKLKLKTIDKSNVMLVNLNKVTWLMEQAWLNKQRFQ